MQANNVIDFDFAFRKRAATVAPKAPPTQWDEDYAKFGKNPAYRIHWVIQSASVAYQLGDIRMGDRLIKACRDEDWDSLITLDKELGDYLLAANFDISVQGVEGAYE